MASAVDIANRALQKMGAKSIVSLTEDSKSARETNRAFDPIRDALLQEYPWAFAKKLKVLPELTTTPAFGWAHKFQLPPDFLRIIKQPDENAYEIIGRELFTDQGSSWNLMYIRQVTDVNDMDPLFREALACRLAYDLMENFTQSRSKKEAAYTMYMDAIKSARKASAMLNQPRAIPQSSWLTVRD